MNNKLNNKLNNKNNEHICLFIEPYVHIDIKDNSVLLYNTLDGGQLVYEDSPEIAALLTRMMAPQNLNAVIEDKAILEEEKLREFLETCRKKEMIDWYGYSKEDGSRKKPVAMPALLNFHRDRKKMARDPERDRGQDIINYLRKINIYINGYHGYHGYHGGHYNNPLFREGYKQFLFPYSSTEYSELKLAAIRQLLEQVKRVGRCGITVLGGNIFQYTELEHLVTYLTQLPLKKELGIFYKDISIDNLERVDWKKLTDISIKIFVEPQLEKNQLAHCIELLKKFNLDASYQFIIRTEADADDLEDVLDLPGQRQLSVKPFYDGENYNFFKENIFIEKADLSEPVVSKKEIYARSVMNPTAFGEVTILSSGDVYSNLNEAPIGTIREGVKPFLLNELSRGRGWFRLRSEQTPCGNCIYQNICPPVSNYEYALSRNNLCWLDQDAGV